MTPNNRKELIEVMARTRFAHVHSISERQAMLAMAGLTTVEAAKWLAGERAILTALEAAGVECVPRVATAMMKTIGQATAPELDFNSEEAGTCYTAMLAANPFKD